MAEVTVGVRDLKARLSEYLRLVREGQIVIITDRGKPVGRIIPDYESTEKRPLTTKDTKYTKEFRKVQFRILKFGA